MTSKSFSDKLHF